jgi:DNA-binding LacI/PurR family transcriptional regulator
MSRRPVSIEDIARAAGVSHSTVSRALRDSPLISADVRGQIRRLADEMGYTPNAIAQSLQMQRTRSIGLVVTSIADPFWTDVVKGVEEVARSANLSVFLSASHSDPEQELAVIDTFQRRRVDGILVADAHIGTTHAARLARIHIPTVLINSQAEPTSDLLHSVTVDDERGARLAVEHLLALGHSAVGYMGVCNRQRSNRRRAAAYRAALAAAGVIARDDWTALVPAQPAMSIDDAAAGQLLMPRLLDAGVTAVFCYNDMLAIGALMACRERGLSIPRDISVVGVDDIHMAQFVMPPLTTIHQPKVRLGALAMQMLLDLLEGRTVEHQHVAPTLVVRGSTGPARPAV